MRMRKSARGAALVGAATAVVVGLGVGPAFAATTWTVKPGGAITAKAGTTKLKDTKTGQTLYCKSSTTKATLKHGSGLAGAKIGKITSVTFSTCTGPFGLTFFVKTSASSTTPWYLNAVSYNATSGVTTGTITGIHAVLTGPSCKAIVDGTGATAHNGKVQGTYTNSTDKLKILASGGNLHIYKVSGCSGLIHSGDPTTFTGVYLVSPSQKITSP